MFSFTISPSFQYKQTVNIIEVEFDINRFERKTITLSPRRNVREAIKLVEQYLNEPVFHECRGNDCKYCSLAVRGDFLINSTIESIESIKVEGGKRLILTMQL